MAEYKMYVHTRCHDCHWELVYYPETGKYDLECEKCGQTAGPTLKITGPKKEAVCEKCKQGTPH